MSDTSLVFNIIARDSGVGRALAAVQKAFSGAGKEAASSFDAATDSTKNLDTMLDEARGRVVSLSQEFEKTGDKTLFRQISKDRSLISNLEKIRSTLRDTGQDAGRAEGDMGGLGSVFARTSSIAASFGGSLSSLGGSIGSAVPPMGQLIGMAVGLSAAMFAAPAAIYAVGAAAASLPGLLSGGIAALFTLKMGLSGLSENWKAMNTPKAGGGGGGAAAPKVDMTPKIRAVEAAQRQVARSTRDITDAQKDLTDATKAVNQARVDERERIDDVRRSLASAKADEEDSVQSLAEARMALASAEQRGNPDEIRRAQIAVDKQAASLAEAKDKTEDLQKEATDAAHKGVEGSDAVVAAKRREQDAQRKVSDAVEAHKLALQQLGDAQKSLNEKIAGAGAAAGGGLGVVLPKIAKSAQAFLDELKRLKPAFDALRLDIQQRLFEGLASKLRILAERWLPALHKGLGDMADTINGVVKTAFDSLSEPSFIKNTMIGVDAVRQALGKVGQAIAGPLIDAWGRLSAASAPFIKMLGDKLAGIITQFSEWIRKADESGKLTTFFEKATSIVGSLLDIMTNLARIAGSVISILFGTQGGSTDAWENLAKATDKVADWLGNPKTQADISRMIDLTGSLWSAFGWLAVNLDDVWHKGENFVAWIKNAYNDVKDFFQKLPDRISGFFTWLGNQLQSLPDRVWGWLKALPDRIWTLFSQAMTNMAYLVGWGIRQVGTFFMNLPGQIWRWLQSLPNVIRASVLNAVAWFQEMGPRAYNALINVGVYAWNALGNLGSLMWNAGYNAVIGIWNGIGSLIPWLWSKMQHVGIDMYNAFMNGIGARSPSVKFAAAARWAMLGAGKGFEDNRAGLMATVMGIAQDIAGVQLGLGTGDNALGDQLTAAANGVMTVQAANRTQRVQVDLNVIGSDGMIKNALQKLNRTSNLKLV